MNSSATKSRLAIPGLLSAGIGYGKHNQVMGMLCQRCGKELPPGVQFCPACGSAVHADTRGMAGHTEVAQPYAEPAKKMVTALFADFQGFTNYTATQDAEEVRDYITSCWKQIAPIIESHGGQVEKYIGDAIAAVFGAERAREEDAIRAVQAALAIQTRLRQIGLGGNQAVLPMRIGIHTGWAVVETDATGVKAFGETAPVADRLQKLAPPGGVLISHDTYRHLRDLFDVQPPRLEYLAGRDNPLLTYVVLRARPRSHRRHGGGIEGAEAGMVGRDAELDLLHAALTTARETHRPRLVTITGDAGMGKSRLVDEFLKQVQVAPEAVRVFCGRGTAEMSGSPFALLRDLVAARFDIQDGDSATVAKNKLVTGIESLMANQNPDTVEAQPENVAHFMGHLAGLDFSGSPHLRGLADDPEQFRQRAFQAVLRFFATNSGNAVGAPQCAAGNVTVLVAEDIHWADNGSLELFQYLGRADSGASLLLVCLARPEFLERHPAWGNDLPAHTVIRLVRLPDGDSSSLVKRILSQAPAIPPDLLERVVRDAEGNPFYIEEIIKMLMDQSVIQPGPEGWQIDLTCLAKAKVPPTLTGVLQARLDGLLPRERAIAQQASVLGRVFWDAAVEYLEMPEQGGSTHGVQDRETTNRLQLVTALQGLCRKQMIRRHDSSSHVNAVEYSFTHDLLRNVAYEGLLKKPLRRFHERAASWLIRQAGERANESAGIIAGHYEKAGHVGEAAEWYGRSGHHAFAGHLPAAAAASFRKALELSSSGSDAGAGLQTKRLQWLDGLAESLGAEAKFREARDFYVDMRELAKKIPDAIAEARACNGLAFLHERQGENLASIEAADHAIELCRQAGSEAGVEKFRALYFKGWAYYRLADAEQVLKLAAQCHELCRELGSESEMSRTFKLYGVAHLQLGHFAEADQFFRQGLELAQKSGDLVTAAAMWSNRAETARARGDYETAAALYQAALDITRQIGWRDSERIYLCNLSAARIGLRQFAEAEADLRAVVAQAATVGAWNLPEALVLLSDACREQGKTQEAIEFGLRGLELARTSGNSLFTADAWRAVARAIAANSGIEPASVQGHQAPDPAAGPDQCFQESLALYQKMGAKGEQARTLRIWAEFDLQHQRPADARHKLEESRRLFTELGMTTELDIVTALLRGLAG